MKKRYSFKAKVWLYPGPAAWFFITLPQKIADEIDFYFSHQKRGWGSLPVKVTIGDTSWKTSIFPDKRSKSYILPLKKEVRKNEKIIEGSSVKITFEIAP